MVPPTISHNLLGFSISILSSVLFLEQSLLTSVSKLWTDTIIPGFETTLLLFIVKPEEMMLVQFLVVLWILRKLFTVEILMQVNVGAAFSLFLKQPSFHVPFPAIMNIGGP